MDGKNLKRFLVLGVLGLFLISMMGSVLAASPSEFFENAFGSLFDFLGDSDILSRVFFALLLAMIVYSVAGSAFGIRGLPLWIATGAIVGLALIGFPANYFESLLMQYGAMGITLLTIIPFAIIAFFTLKVGNLMIATATWAVYSVYYFGLFGQKLYEGISNGEKTLDLIFSANVFPYALAFFIGVIMAVWGVSYARKHFSKGMIDAQVEQSEASIRRRTAGLKAEAKRLEATGIDQDSS